MTKVIAVAGKGGTGKTTFSALVVKELIKQTQANILAVDADPNSNLNEALGLELRATIADILDELKSFSAIPQGMPKDVFMEYRLNQVLIESPKFDLLVMGVPQGSGCYCYPNDLMRKHLEVLRANYDYLVLDNEAGMEHLSRKVVTEIDFLLIISDATARGVRSADRVKQIVDSVGINVKKVGLVITKTTEAGINPLNDEIMRTGLELIGTIPYDEEVVKLDLAGEPLFNLTAETKAVQAVAEIVQQIGLISGKV